eukprot:TRINITY_DN26394_c0_g1_i2.p1 TRINITY_DN26394_c0_g1~~TRINITY_DN26394_c0_g1_i2.p1  ORF type:complete len:178 (-),score=26.12 TRINITY_DN26394_c0_g1_i2:41-574(-)
MHTIVKSKLSHGGLTTEVQEPAAMLPTSMLSMGTKGALGGAAAGGGLAYLLCMSKCPGKNGKPMGIGGAIGNTVGGITGAIGGGISKISGIFSKTEKDANKEENEPIGLEKAEKQVHTIRSTLCGLNCKLAGMVGAAAGGAAGHMYGKRKQAQQAGRPPSPGGFGRYEMLEIGRAHV